MDIDLEKAKEEFLKYVSEFDLNDENIILKRDHSIRVMELSEKISKMMNLNQLDMEIASIIGLLHDIARFEQIKQYNTFDDLKSFDHGDYGVELLNKYMRKYVETVQFDEIIKKAVKNHNKFSIESGLTESELFFSKLIRDADKLDILYLATIMFWEGKEDLINNSEVSPKVLNSFLNKQLVEIKPECTYTKTDRVILIISYIFDINFKESFIILQQEDYINKILNRFEFKGKERIQEFANNYIKEKIGI